MSRKNTSAEPAREASDEARNAAWLQTAATLGAFIALGLFAYQPALDGQFISDDLHYVQANPYIQNPSWENLAEILDPGSGLVLMVENYAPVHLLLHSAGWQLFGSEVYGHHVMNVVLHALAALLLVVFFRRTGIPERAALLGGGIFLLHPANVEAVAWISQLKSSSALVLALGALLVRPKRPLVGAVLFGLALLAKPSALLALPVAIVMEWVETRADAATPPAASRSRAWLWVGAWALVFVAFCAVEISAFRHTAGHVASLYADEGLLVSFRSHVGIAMRYLVIVVTSVGLSTFHEPAAAMSWLDPWWLAGLGALAIAGWRSLAMLWQRRTEAVYWAWAAAAFAPASGLLALPYPMADRYLYAVLPGLIGIAILAGRELVGRLPEATTAKVLAAAPVLAVILALFFAWRAHDRASIWRASAFVMADAIANYPEGTAAKLRDADRAALVGDADTAIAALRAAHKRGYERLDQLLQRPSYAFMRDDPRFKALVDEIARTLIDRALKSDRPTQTNLHAMGVAHQILGETDAAVRAMERAAEMQGPIDDQVAKDLQQLRSIQRREALRKRS